MQPTSQEMQAMNNISSLLNTDIQPSHFDPTSHDDFFDQMLSSINPSSNSSFPWEMSSATRPDDSVMPPTQLGQFDDQSAMLASKLRQHQIGGGGAARALMLQQQLMMSKGLAGSDLRSPSVGGDGGFMPLPLGGEHNDVAADGSSFKSANSGDDAALQALYNGFTGSLGQTPNQAQHFHQSQGHTFGAAATPATNQPAASGSTGGGMPAQPRQRVRARRGQATDPHSIAERLRRERIAERMKALQELVPNANKTDKASMLDEIIDYVKFLQLQVKVLSMSRLGGAAAVAPLVADVSPEGRASNGTQTASSSNNNDTMTVTEHQVAKLMEEDMGSAMQYLQGKGLCLMPISLATAISTATCHTRKPMLKSNSSNNINNNPLLNGDIGGPSSPNMSALTVQSAVVGGNGGGEASVKDSTSA